MRPWILLIALVLAGCAASSPAPVSGADPAAAPSPLGSPFSGARPAQPLLDWPVFVDRADLGLSTSVMLRRIPTIGELHDFESVNYGFQHLILILPGWPSGPDVIESLNQLAPETDAVVILPGYPPSRAAAEAWNQLVVRVRIIAIVGGPPEGVGVLSDLNAMRGLERVIAQMERPSRAGFERLQRPLGFRRVVD